MTEEEIAKMIKLENENAWLHAVNQDLQQTNVKLRAELDQALGMKRSVENALRKPE